MQKENSWSGSWDWMGNQAVVCGFSACAITLINGMGGGKGSPFFELVVPLVCFGYLFRRQLGWVILNLLIL